MRIGIDARMFGPGFGLGRYVQQLVTQLEKIDRDNEYVIFLRKENWDLWKPQYDNFTKVEADIAWYTLAEQLQMSKIIKQQNVDFMHFPHWNVPLLYNKPFVVTIHDLIMFHYARPEATTHGKFIFKIKDIIHRMVVRHAAKKSKHIIATSEFTKQDIVDTLNIDKKKITSIYQAPFGDKHWELTDKSVLDQYGIEKDYVIYVGAAYPHKNLENLLKAWQLFEEQYGDEYHLVLVGTDNYFYRRLKESDLFKKSKNIIHTGFVSDEELTSLYAWASLYVFPSLYEGFGLPPFEAIKHDIPVVSSNASCLPEVLGDAALYFDPENPAHICDVMRTALHDSDIQMQLLENGRIRRVQFSSREFAEKTRGIYEKVK